MEGPQIVCQKKGTICVTSGAPKVLWDIKVCILSFFLLLSLFNFSTISNIDSKVGISKLLQAEDT